MPTSKYRNYPAKARLLLLAITLLLIISIPTQVFALTMLWNSPQTLDNSTSVGRFTSLAVVSGTPAISYYDITNNDLKFIRAQNSNGTNWDFPQTLDDSGNVGFDTSLAVIHGFPAVSYFDFTNNDLKFIRAANYNGTSWNAPQTLDTIGDLGRYTSLATVNGVPAISYYDFGSGSLKFIRATDANGTSWDAPQTLDSTGNVGGFTSLAVVNGIPAISYFDYTNGDLKFIRATNANGTSWDVPQILDSTGDVGLYTSLTVVNGVPAISYFYSIFPNGNLKFIHAADADGTSWNAPQTLDSMGLVGLNTSLAVVNGMPAISYFDNTNNNLKFIHAMDVSGTSWNVPQILDSTGIVGEYSSLAVVNGSPAISYFDGINNTLKFIRAFGTVDISVWNGGAQINNGDTLAFGSTTLGTPITITLTLQNNGSTALDLQGLVLPTGFSLTGTYPNEIASGDEQAIQIRLEAYQTGTFSGALSLSSTDDNLSPLSITLSGEVTTSNGEIAVFDGATEIMDNSGAVNYGTTTIGTPISHTFNVQNSSSEDLELYSLTLPTGFSLSSAYNHSIVSGGSTTITVQLDSQIVGSYGGEFSLTTNDADENPFNFTISGEVGNTLLETGIIAPLSGSTVINSDIQVSFNHDVLHDGSADAANNPVNYLLVEDGDNGIFDTSTCLLGLAGDDVQAAISSVTYNASTYTATVNTGTLPSGRYQLLVCGTASIEDASGNVLNNGAFDSSTTFTVVSSGTGNTGGTGTAGTSGTALLPATGFAPHIQTVLPVQPAAAAYNDMDSLRLQIPGLKVDASIVGVPKSANGWDVTWLTNAQAGWLNGSAYPTWDGNTVLTGHITNASGNSGPFANIKTLKFGDEITIQAYGETYTYEVRENKLVTRDNMNVVEEHKDLDWVTLITCEGYNESTGEYIFRRVVRAVLVEVN